MEMIKKCISEGKALLGIEFGSTRIKAVLIDNNHAPIGGENWSVTATADGAGFNINLVDLSNSECAFFATAVPKWATAIIVNGYEINETSNNCFSGNTNELTFVVE